MKDEHNDDFDGESYNATIIVCVALVLYVSRVKKIVCVSVLDKEERVSKPLSLPDALFSSLTQNTHERLSFVGC